MQSARGQLKQRLCRYGGGGKGLCSRKSLSKSASHILHDSLLSATGAVRVAPPVSTRSVWLGNGGMMSSGSAPQKPFLRCTSTETVSAARWLFSM